MKEFWTYTALRLAIFVATFGVIAGGWLLVADNVPLMWLLVASFVISGVLSLFLLNNQRESFARRVDERARRASAAFEEMKAKEDTD